MSSEIQRMFASLAADADSAPLARASELRSRSDRRSRTRLAVGLVAVAVAVGGMAIGGRLLLTGQPPITPPPADSATVAPSPGGTPIPESIPDEAFLTAAETRDEKPNTADSDDMLPSLCGAKFPSDSAIGVRRTVEAAYRNPDTPRDYVPSGVAEQTITVYQGSGAGDFMTEIRAAARACPDEEVSERVTCRYRVLAPPDLGDEALLIEQSCEIDIEPGDPGTGKTTSRVAVVRSADAVLVLYFSGWEGAQLSAGHTQRLTRLAAQHLIDWRG